ncbi:hypothetical protein [Desulfoluna sp.]|uniref:rhodanese-like domain-containing protein n=1 Tax=Desulfoluna sp. TaxID=2045199 RepID=UPI00261FD0C0|nr:hypothetical protein [Desulfoluna sp.]
MTEVPRVSPAETRGKLIQKKAMLVCAYASDDQFKQMQLDGAIPLSRFEARLPMLPRTQEIIFYCA